MGQGRPPLPKIKSPDDLDNLDLEIVAALEVDPKTPCRIIAEKTGVGVTTVWDRIQRIRKSDWVEQMRIDLKALGGISLDAVQNGMVLGDVSDRAGIALRLLDGLGVTEPAKRKVEISLADATPEQIKSALEKLSDDDLRAIIAKRNSV